MATQAAVDNASKLQDKRCLKFIWHNRSKSLKLNSVELFLLRLRQKKGQCNGIGWKIVMNRLILSRVVEVEVMKLG